MVVNIACCQIHICCWNSFTIAVTLDPFIIVCIALSLLYTFFNISYSSSCMSNRWQEFYIFPYQYIYFFSHKLLYFPVSSDATSDKVHPVISKLKVNLSLTGLVRLLGL
jgi:hypothetical protein